MTVALKLGEQLVEALTAKLKANLPARQDAITAKYDDLIQLAHVDDLNYYGGRVSELQGFPAIFIMEGPTTFKWEGSDGLITDTELLVYVYDSDQTGPQLSKRLQRQVRAVIEATVWDSPAMQLAAVPPFVGLSAILIRPTRTVPGTVFEPSAPDAWRAFYTIVFSAKQLEN